MKIVDPSILLTLAEVHELTGRKQSAAQTRWLAERGWKYELDSDGHPKVAREYFEQRLVQGPPATGPQTAEFAVNVEALRCAR
jgi:hypothetical protein